ncbi:GAF domain-containing SpoIIE family protein phosphatase [Nostoc sp. UHCC 0302]|uniref:GAF domain-containing SpoIIE family protein phosphatase n=1 Tax=Nostoc sp. UHCC 0302 TaxID=3134896 RepID=UPI00311CBBC2
MIKISLKKLVSKKEVISIIKNSIDALDTPINILDIDGKLLFGEKIDNPLGKYLVELGSEMVGEVIGGEKASLIASLLSDLATQEVEKKSLTGELLDKYREISLLYKLSENLSGNLEIQKVAELVIEEALKLIKATSASVMLLNNEIKKLEIIVTFGTSYNRQTTIEPNQGIIGSVVHTGRAEIVNDVLSDPRCVESENKISSLICAPLKIRDEVIGVINLSSESPVEYTSADFKLLTTLASQAASAIENAIRHKNQIKEAMARTELEKGRQIQTDFLPDQIIQVLGWETAALFEPARQVAGDFYDTFMLPDGCVGLVIADVCDKGVGAALFMALFRSFIRVFSGQTSLQGLTILNNELLTTLNASIDRTEEINITQIHALRAVELTHNYVAQNHSNLNMFATLFFGVLNPVTGLLAYVNGGHEPLAILDASGVKQRLMPTGPAVGIPSNKEFKIQQVYLQPGDILLGYTDGVTDARSPSKQFFTEKKLLSLLQEPAESVAALIERIKVSLITHIASADQFDDITILAIQRTPRR